MAPPNVKKEKLKKKFLEERYTEKVKCLMSVYKKLVLEKKKEIKVGDKSYRKIYRESKTVSIVINFSFF